MWSGSPEVNNPNDGLSEAARRTMEEVEQPDNRNNAPKNQYKGNCNLDEALNENLNHPEINNVEAAMSVSSSSSTSTLSLNSKLMREEEETFYSAEDNPYGDDSIWGLLSGVAGNMYEWYDFAVYGLLSSEIGANFFPKSSKQLQLINSFGVFLAAFLMRPIGAIMFGEIGDRICGRKHALVASIILITVPSVLMGILPTYYTIGNWAPALLVILRMMQGLSVGGQLAGSYVLSIEQSTSSTRGFRGSVCDASSVGGFVLASFVTTMVRNYMSNEYQMEEWGWRVPFLLSLVFSPILYFIVSRSEESKLWSERNDQKEDENVIREQTHVEQTPAFMDLLRSPFRRRQLLGMIGVMSVKACSFYTLFVWTPLYMSELRGLVTTQTADLMNLAVVSCYIIFLLIAGKMSDKFPHRQDLMKIGILGCTFAAPVMFAMFESESPTGYFFAQLQYALCMSFIQGGLAAWEVELWMADPTLSFTGVAMGHNFSATIFGGTTPLVATCLYYYALNHKNDPYSSADLYWRMLPGIYVSLLGFMSLYCIGFVIRHPHDIRTGEKQVREARAKQMKKRNKKMKNKVISVIGSSGFLTSPASTFGMESARDNSKKNKNSTNIPNENIDNAYTPPLI